MIKFFKEHKKIIQISLVFLIIAIIFPIVILYPTKYGFITHKDGLEIVGYGGSILGGFFTLFGVWWTIADNKKQKMEEFSIQYKPYMSLPPRKELEDRGIDIKDCVKYDTEENKYKFELIYQNIGSGEAANLRIQIYSGNINIYDSKKEYIDVFPDNLLHRIQFSKNDDFIDYKTTRTFKVIFSYKDGFSFYQYEMHYYIQYVIQNKQIISYSVSLDHKSSKTQRIENKKSKNESEE